MSKEEIKTNMIDWRPWEHRQFMQSTPELMTKAALVEYVDKEVEGKAEIEVLIKNGILTEEDLK